MDDKLFEIILALIPIIGIAISSFLIPWLRANTNATKLDEITKWITFAVKAAEQIILGDKMGAEKKAFVVDYIMGLLEKKKIKLTEEQLDILIEAVVLELKK